MNRKPIIGACSHLWDPVCDVVALWCSAAPHALSVGTEQGLPCRRCRFVFIHIPGPFPASGFLLWRLACSFIQSVLWLMWEEQGVLLSQRTAGGCRRSVNPDSPGHVRHSAAQLSQCTGGIYSTAISRLHSHIKSEILPQMCSATSQRALVLSEAGDYQNLPLIPRLVTVCLQSFTEPLASACADTVGVWHPWLPLHWGVTSLAAPGDRACPKAGELHGLGAVSGSVCWQPTHCSLRWTNCGSCNVVTAQYFSLKGPVDNLDRCVTTQGAAYIWLINSSKCCNENHNESID